MNESWEESDSSHSWDEDWDSDDLPADDGDYGGSSEGDLIACPDCRELIHEDSVRCPNCGHYVLEESRYTTAKSPISQRFFVAIVVLVIGALLLPFLLGLLSMLRAAAG